MLAVQLCFVAGWEDVSLAAGAEEEWWWCIERRARFVSAGFGRSVVELRRISHPRDLVR
jgi:hypothetical protein